MRWRDERPLALPPARSQVGSPTLDVHACDVLPMRLHPSLRPHRYSIPAVPHGRDWGWTVTFTYRGRHRNGTHTAGTLAAATDLPDMVESVYRAGWRDLTVEDADGTEVGGIVAHPDTGLRAWWADNNAQRPASHGEADPAAAGTGGAR